MRERTMKTCPECHRSIAKNAKHCQFCGHHFELGSVGQVVLLIFVFVVIPIVVKGVVKALFP